MLSEERLVEFYGGLPAETIVRAQGSGWWIKTPTIKVEGNREIGVLIQGGIHSQAAQLSHKIRRFHQEEFPVICLDQSGAATVEKSSNFYDVEDYSRFVARDLAILDGCGLGQVIAYGSSIGGPATIALAAEHPERVAAVIAVNPASLIRQNPWWVAAKFLFSSREKVKRDFVRPPTAPPSFGTILKEELLGRVKTLVASDISRSYLRDVKCPVLIYTGRQDRVFPWQRLRELEEWNGSRM